MPSRPTGPRCLLDLKVAKNHRYHYYARQLNISTSELVKEPAGTGRLVVLTRGHGRGTRRHRRHAARLRTVVCDAGRARFRRRCGSGGGGGGGGKASRAVGTGKGVSLDALAGGGTVEETGRGMLWGHGNWVTRPCRVEVHGPTAAYPHAPLPVMCSGAAA